MDKVRNSKKCYKERQVEKENSLRRIEIDLYPLFLRHDIQKIPKEKKSESVIFTATQKEKEKSSKLNIKKKYIN